MIFPAVVCATDQITSTVFIFVTVTTTQITWSSRSAAFCIQENFLYKCKVKSNTYLRACRTMWIAAVGVTESFRINSFAVVASTS